MKKFSTGLISCVGLSVLLGCLLPLQIQAESSGALDFAGADSRLQNQELALRQLELEHGRYGYQLLEPLEQLARQQLAVSRYSDAAAVIDRAIQISRINAGLYTPEQYDLVQFSIEIALLRKDWDAFDQQIAHYSYLIGSRYQGDARERLSRMLWLAEIHVRSAVNNIEERVAQHLIQATRINETAVRYAQHTDQAETLLYAQALHSLSEKYFLESRAIFGSGEIGYKLRQYGPNGGQIHRRGAAVSKRYRAGLDKLQMLRQLFLESDKFGPEAVAMAELYIADWHAVFDADADLGRHYRQSMESLLTAGVSQARLDQFFARPAVLPRPRLHLDLDAALTLANTARESGFAASQAGTSSNSKARAQLLEPSPFIPGYSIDMALLDWTDSQSEDWDTVTLTLELQPKSAQPYWLGLYRSESRAISASVKVRDAGDLPAEELDAVVTRASSLPFRPAFVDGQPVPGKIAVEFAYNRELISSSAPRLASTELANPWANGRMLAESAASPVAAGE